MATCPPLTEPDVDSTFQDDEPSAPWSGARTRAPQERLLHITLPPAAFFLSWWQVGRIPAMNISISDILLVVSMGLILSMGGLNSRVFGRYTAIWVGGLTMLLGGMLVGSLSHGDFLRWPIVASQYAFAMLLVPMFLAACPRPLLERCATAYVLGVAASQVIGIALINLFSRSQLTGMINKYVVTGNARLGAMTGEPNSNGAVCAFALVFLVRAMMIGRIRWPGGLALGFILLVGLIYSASFTGTFAALLAMVFMLSFYRFRTFIKVAIPAVLILLAYANLGGPVPAVFEQRVGDALLSGDPTRAGTFVGRSALIVEAWHLADDNLVIGLGSDGYRATSPHGMPVHQLYLLVLNEGGVVSFLGLCLMALALLLQGRAITRLSRIDGIACLSILAIFFIYTMSLPHMFARLWNGPVMLVFALTGWLTWRYNTPDMHGFTFAQEDAFDPLDPPADPRERHA